jgi:hypothetical protein
MGRLFSDPDTSTSNPNLMAPWARHNRFYKLVCLGLDYKVQEGNINLVMGEDDEDDEDVENNVKAKAKGPIFLPRRQGKALLILVSPLGLMRYPWVQWRKRYLLKQAIKKCPNSEQCLGLLERLQGKLKKLDEVTIVECKDMVQAAQAAQAASGGSLQHASDSVESADAIGGGTGKAQVFTVAGGGGSQKRDAHEATQPTPTNKPNK